MKLISNLDVNGNHFVNGELSLLFPSVTGEKIIATHDEIEAVIAEFGGAFQFKGSAIRIKPGTEPANSTIVVADAEAQGSEKEIVAGSKNQGNVYQIGDKEYASNGSVWVELGFNIDLSAYETIAHASSTYATISSLGNLADRVTTAEGNITSLGTRVGTAEGDIDSLETRMGTAEGSITDHGTRLTTAEGDINTLKTSVSNLASTVEENEEITSSALNDLNARITNTKTEGAVTITESTPKEVAKRYTVAQGGVTVGTIDIPKDLVVEEGSVVDVTFHDNKYWDGATDITAAIDPKSQHTTGDLAGKFIKLVIANSQELPLYIAAADLVDIYTEGNGIDISEANVISAKIDSSNANGLSASANGLALATVVASTSGAGGSNGAMTAAQAEKLAGITSGAQVNVIEGVKLSDSSTVLTPDKNKVVTIANATPGTNGTDGTDGLMSSEDKYKLNNVAAGAQVNLLEGIQIDGTDVAIDSNKKANITTLATKERVEKVERVAAAAINDLNDRTEDVESGVKSLGTRVTALESAQTFHSYLSEAITDSATKTTTITASTHSCGQFPLVQVYLGNDVVSADVAVNNNNDVIVTWAATPSTSTPIRIRIVG